MSSKEEKARRKQIVHALREESRGKVREQLPIPAADLKRLFDFLDDQLSDAECDGALDLTLGFTRQNQFPEGALIAWLEKNGGHCDCEALANVEPIVEEAVAGYSGIGEGTTTIQ